MSTPKPLTPRAGRARLWLILATAAVLIAYAAMFTWRAVVWHHVGWTGVVYVPHKDPGKKDVSLPIFGYRSGAVQYVLPDSPVQHAGIRSGDQILAINGIKPITANSENLKALGNKLKSGDRIVYTIQRGSEPPRDVPVVLQSRFTAVPTVVAVIAGAVTAMVYLAIGFAVLWVRPSDRRALVFCAFCFLAALIEWGGTFAQLDGFAHTRGIVPAALMPASSAFVVAGVMILAVGLGIVLLHLALIFPRERPIVRENPAIWRFIYVIPYVTMAWGVGLFAGFAVPKRSSWGFLLLASEGAALAAVMVILRRRSRTIGWKRTALSAPLLSSLAAGLAIYFILHGVAHLSTFALQPKPFRIAIAIFSGVLWLVVVLGMALGYPLATCVALFRSYRESGIEEKRQIRWPIWGTVAGLGGATFIQLASVALAAFAPSAMSQNMIAIPGDLLSKAAYLLIPASFAASILKYRLMEVDLVIKKTVVYGSLTATIIILYLIIVGGLGGLLVRTAGVRSQPLTIAFTLALAVAFIPVRNRLQAFVDRRMFRRRRDYPQALREVNRAVTAAATRGNMLKAVAELVQPALQNRSVVIFEGDEQGRSYVATAKVGVPDQIIGQVRFERSESLVPQLTDTKPAAALNLSDEESARLRKVSPELIVPIRLSGRLAGFITLGAKLSDEDFDLEDHEFLTSVADQLAIGLDMVRLRTEEQEFHQASEIQKALLPKDIPQLEGFRISGLYQPSRVVGGDYYDVLKLSANRVALCIGDVAGKGMPAALLMSSLQATVKAVATETAPPREVCERVRNVLVGNMSAGKFLTFFYCVLDAGEKKLRFTNAGHNPPIVMRADGSVTRLEDGGAAIARMFRALPFRDGEVRLAGGDRVVLFTDGVTEARSAAGEDFGEERLIEVLASNRELPPEELQRQILDSVTTFSQGNLGDDVTLAILAVA